MKSTYKAPELKTYGSAKQLTLDSNKKGTASDVFTGQTGLCGDIVSCGPCTTNGAA